MRNVEQHIQDRLDLVKRVIEHDWEKGSRYKIVPKKFTVERVSELGKECLGFKTGEEREFSGQIITERLMGAGRVFFLPKSIQGEHEAIKRYAEIKGYGNDGRDMCLWLHCDGDILNGMFYKNAKKEYGILEKAFSNGLRVPEPLFLGKIPKNEWLKSGLRTVNWISHDSSEWDAKLAGNLSTLRDEISRKMQSTGHPNMIGDYLGAFSQPYNAGVLGRAPITPLRMGDPADNYKLTDEIRGIARQCGETFYKLIDLGYLHLSPGTGNWTEAGELTDMADCYDLKKDKNLQKVIEEREKNWDEDFWESLIGSKHTANLSPFFIEGMFGRKMLLQDAAHELRERVFDKIKELRN